METRARYEFFVFFKGIFIFGVGKMRSHEMKSMYFRNLAKGLVIVSAALALVNCNDTTAAAEDAISDAQQQYQDLNNPNVDPNNPNGGVVDPNAGQQDPNGGLLDPNGNQNIDPNTGLPNNPVDGNVDPNGNTNVDPNANGQNGNVQGGQGDPNGNQNVDTTLTQSSSSEATNQQNSSSSEAAKVESSSSEEVKPAGIFLAEGSDENKDQMEVEYIQNIEPCEMDNKGNRLCQILSYPKRLSDTKKHGVVVWGPGGGTAPGAYEGMIRRLASHGFVVVALRSSPGNGNYATEVLNWLDEKNKNPSDPLYNKLDLTKVGCSGHSMGGLESEQAVIKDERVITAFLNNSGDWNASGANKVSPRKTIAILYGEGGMERGNAEADYNQNNVVAPACLIEMTGGTGNECYEVTPGYRECGWGHGSGSWDGLGATVSWMRWHLGGEDFRKADFVGSSGAYIDGPIKVWDWQGNMSIKGKWKGQCKNF